MEDQHCSSKKNLDGIIIIIMTGIWLLRLIIAG